MRILGTATCNLPPASCLPPALLPFSRFCQLLDLALDQVTLERADVRDVEPAVQVIRFVQEGAGQQLFAGALEEFAVDVLSANGHGLGASHFFAKLWETQAALGAALAALLVND